MVAAAMPVVPPIKASAAAANHPAAQDSPEISTGMVEVAAFSAMRSTLYMAGLFVMMKAERTAAAPF